jgi:preprotein translocase subunit SecD
MNTFFLALLVGIGILFSLFVAAVVIVFLLAFMIPADDDMDA